MHIFYKLFLALRSAGLETTLRTIRSTLYKDWLEKRYAPPRQAGHPQKPGRLLQSHSLPGGGRFQFESAELEIQFLAPDMARISWEPGTPPVPYALAHTSWPEVETILQTTAEGCILESRELRLTIQADGALSFCDSSGNTLRNELPPLRLGNSPDHCSWTHQACLAPEERLYGLGEQSKRLDLRGGTHRLWNSDPGGSYGPGKDPLYTTIPVYFGLHLQGSYLVFYENYSSSVFTFEPPGPCDRPLRGSNFLAEARFDSGMLRYYFIPGPVQRAIERYTELTGRPPLPPLWSLGYHQCRWGYKTEQDIRQVAAGFMEQDMPLSAIHLDIDYMDGYRVFTVDRHRFPDMQGLSEDMKALGVRLVSILDPGVKQDDDYFLYREGMKAGVFCGQPDRKPYAGLVWPGWSVFPDFTDPKTRRWWGAQYQRLLDAGIAGFWHDMNEPTSFTAWGEMTMPACVRHAMEGKGGDHRLGHNLYGLQMNRAGYEALQSLCPARRPWIISRAGWAGQQRYAWNWTGDTESTWAALRMAIPTILGMGLSGLPFSGPDIGGFSGSPSAELYIRALQMAAFLPFFRTHSAIGTARREPWVYGEPYTGIIRQFLKLRYRLLPYLYTLAWQASQDGRPLVRPLFWDNPQDTHLWDVDDAFLLGDALLVAPILEEGASARQVCLPAGDWYSFWDDAQFRGGGLVDLETCLELIPVLVRAGSLLPMQKDDKLILHIYPSWISGKSSSQYVYSDEGDGYGDWRLVHFNFMADGKHLELAWETEGTYPFPFNQVEIQLHGPQARRAWQDGREILCHQNILEVTPFKHVRLEI